MRDGLLDWDCAGAIDIPGMAKALAYIRANGVFPVSAPGGIDLWSPPPPSPRADRRPRLQPFVDSKEDKNSVGPCPVSGAKIEQMRQKVAAWMQPGSPGHAVLATTGLRLCLLDGFLLYAEEMRAAMDLLDVKLFLRVSKAKATQRRGARDGYVTLEGFWQDPPGYVDKIVWPNYVESHAWLFENGHVEGALRAGAVAEQGLLVQQDKGLDVDMETTLEWAVDALMERLEAFQP